MSEGRCGWWERGGFELEINQGMSDSGNENRQNDVSSEKFERGGQLFEIN